VVAVYSANLTAFLAESPLQTPMKSFDDLALDRDFLIGTFGGGAGKTFYMVSG
jgi:hypothetical protein